MANIDFSSQYRRLVRFFWDPEPVNDGTGGDVIWCLGERYDASACSQKHGRPGQKAQDVDPDSVDDQATIAPRSPAAIASEANSVRMEATPASSTAPSVGDDKGWPPQFLDDFESRFWFTYRSEFPLIERSPASDSSSTLTMSVRLRSQLVDQSGFTSDTGFGCMIRSGQSLLANALAMLRLGRGKDVECLTRRFSLLMTLSRLEKRSSAARGAKIGLTLCGRPTGPLFSTPIRCPWSITVREEPGRMVRSICGSQMHRVRRVAWH